MRARDNPFRTERILQVRYQLQGIQWSDLLARCQTLRYRAALIGRHGAGKTTLLENLEPRLNDLGFRTRLIRLSQENRAFEPGFLKSLFAGLSTRDIILFDGAEQMNLFAWQSFRWRSRHVGGLIITTHQPGRLPTLWECRTSPALLARIAAELLDSDPETIQELADALFRKHRGNLRDALREWYDLEAAGHHSTASLCV